MQKSPLLRPYLSVKSLLVLIFLFLCSTVCHAEETVRVQLSWKYQFQFAAFIAAYEKGFYQQAGLNVQLIEGGPNINSVQEVTSAHADYGIYSSALLVEYAKSKNVVALASLMQHSAVAMLTDKPEIHSVFDLAGKKIAVSEDTRDELTAYLLASGLSEPLINMVPKTQAGIANLADHAAISTYISNEAFYTQQEPQRYLLLSPRSAGIDLFGNILFTSREHLDKSPDEVAAFRAATLKGLNYALSHQEELVDLILARYNTQNKTRAHLLYEAQRIYELTRPDIVEPGYMSEGRWQHVADVYSSLGRVPEEIDLQDFIYDPNPKVNLSWLYALLGVSALGLLILALLLQQSKRFNNRLQFEIQERKRAEVALTQNEQHFKKLFNENPDPCWLLNQTRFIECNQSSAFLLGYTEPKELQQQQLALCLPDKQPNGINSLEFLLPYIQLAQHTQVVRFECTLQHRSGVMLTVEMTMAPYQLNDAVLIYCVWRNISERKQIDRLKDEFVSTVSHELRTPLTSIIGGLGLVLGGVGGGLSEQAQTLLKLAKRNADNLLMLINDILDISKIEAGKLEYSMSALTLDTFLDECLRSVHAYAEKYQVSFVMLQTTPQLVVLADKYRLTQVLNNLLSNAAKFSTENSKIEIELLEADGYAEINIRDYGVGIPEEFQARIFEKFSQANSSDTRHASGTGLGLHISKLIIEHHHGALTFQSYIGQGTTFTIRLPLVDKQNLHA